jgi:hypothetical protein
MLSMSGVYQSLGGYHGVEEVGKFGIIFTVGSI